MTLSLSDVTLVVIDTVAHDLAREAIKSTLEHIAPKEVLVWSDKRFGYWDTIPVEINNMDEYCKCLWYSVPQQVKTTHYLVIQWDSWVLDASCWKPHWLDYDYIGAPWWYSDFQNMGNGGFSLRSTDMSRWLVKKSEYFPLTSPKEDDLLCRQYQWRLAQAGFTFAPESEAKRFSFERVPVKHNTFGFHGIFNWDKVLSPNELDHRISLCNGYVQSRSEWQELKNSYRQLEVA